MDNDTNLENIRKKQEETRNQFYGIKRKEGRKEERKVDSTLMTSDGENAVAKIIRIIAIVEMVLGLIVGYKLANSEIANILHTKSGFQWSVALTWWISTIVSGFLLLGFSEIVRLLHEINNKVK
ncbi:hypothetical protein [Paenibacillus thalictri]|uniref:Uncharacterized protein n=1 Tax=Paenibacillus thalictri TaxID=2527873 RepID=A0A4Q9DHU2_9BACL|nr:hypothetical protein [Paenibacillus thalictri]TBL69937.1 hypothetical protein EYB31_34785 [Paenibacillus thalictri]